LHHHRTTPPPPPLHHYTAKQPHQETCSNTNLDLEEDTIQHQNTGSDAGLKRKTQPDPKKATAGDKDKASVAGVKENQWWSEHQI
jgi:hypothetical protein